jgi:hypothetical protein
LVFFLALRVVVEPDDVGVSHPRVDRALSAGELMRQGRDQIRFNDRLLY